MKRYTRGVGLGLAAALAIGICGCQIYSISYDPESNPQPPVTTTRPAKGDKLAVLYPTTIYSGFHYNTRYLYAANPAQGLFPAMRFDLSRIPDDARISRASLRLRRVRATPRTRTERPLVAHLEILNVNRGLRAKRVVRDRTVDMIVRVEAFEKTEDEDGLWLADRTTYDPVHSTCYVNFAFLEQEHDGRLGIEWLRDWNGSRVCELSGGDCWDILDLTEFVRTEYRSESKRLSLLLTLRVSAEFRAWEICRMIWFGTDPATRGNRVAYYPTLSVEYEVSPK